MPPCCQGRGPVSRPELDARARPVAPGGPPAVVRTRPRTDPPGPTRPPRPVRTPAGRRSSRRPARCACTPSTAGPGCPGRGRRPRRASRREVRRRTPSRCPRAHRSGTARQRPRSRSSRDRCCRVGDITTSIPCSAARTPCVGAAPRHRHRARHRPLLSAISSQPTAIRPRSASQARSCSVNQRCRCRRPAEAALGRELGRARTGQPFGASGTRRHRCGRTGSGRRRAAPPTGRRPPRSPPRSRLSTSSKTPNVVAASCAGLRVVAELGVGGEQGGTWPGNSISGTIVMPRSAAYADQRPELVLSVEAAVRCAVTLDSAGRRVSRRQLRDLLQPRVTLRLEPPALVVGEMQVEDVELVQREQVDEPEDVAERHEVTARVQMHARANRSAAGPRSRPRQRERPYPGARQQSGAAAAAGGLSGRPSRRRSGRPRRSDPVLAHRQPVALGRPGVVQDGSGSGHLAALDEIQAGSRRSAAAGRPPRVPPARRRRQPRRGERSRRRTRRTSVAVAAPGHPSSRSSAGCH